MHVSAPRACPQSSAGATAPCPAAAPPSDPRGCASPPPATTTPPRTSSDAAVAHAAREAVPPKPDAAAAAFVRQLRQMPEGAALARAEADLRAAGGLYDQGRRLAATTAEAQVSFVESVEDARCSFPPRRAPRAERWRLAALAAGVSPDWRPPGGACTLFLPEHEHIFDDMRAWVGAAKRECQAVERGEDPDPPPDLHVSAALMRPEARALAPWLTGGIYAAAPVPVAVVYPSSPRGLAHGGHDVDLEWFLKQAADPSEPDPGIAFELADGLESESAAVDSNLAFHHPSFWGPDEAYREKSLAALRDEAAQGAFIELGEVPMLPLRCSPRFIVDQGYYSDGIRRRLRAILNLAWGDPSVNDLIDLADLHDLKLTSGVRFGRAVGILREMLGPIGIALLKRDMKNAFRQLPFSPLDWWQQCCISPRGVEVDTRVVMGCRASVHKFQRVAELVGRAIRRRLAAFDSLHPIAVPAVERVLATRAAKLAADQARKTSATHVYIDDAVHGTSNDPIPTASLHGPERELALAAPSAVVGAVERGRAHEAIIDDTYAATGIVMAGRACEAGIDDKAEYNTEKIEGLGVEVDAAMGVLRYPPRKISGLRQSIRAVLAKTKAQPITNVSSLIGKEKWLAHVALELDHFLRSGYAIAKCNAPYVVLSAQFRIDQEAVLRSLDEPHDVPLVAASAFPPPESPSTLLVFQDASTSTGIGGWFARGGTLYFVHEEWSAAQLRLFADGTWSISPAEAWAELVLLSLAATHAPDARTVTNFTDNESTRAAARRGSSRSSAMDPLARAIAALGVQDGRITRTVRVTTKENALADALSRGDYDAVTVAAAHLRLHAVRLRVPDELWAYVPRAA